MDTAEKAEHNASPETEPDGGREGATETHGLLRWLVLAGQVLVVLACAGLLASMAAVPSIAPYHVRVRGVYLTLVPLTVGYLVGALCHEWAARHLRMLLIGAGTLLLLALIPRLRQDAPPLTIYPILLTGVAAAVVFVRLGLLQAGITWGARARGDWGYQPWLPVVAYGFAWAWLLAAVLNPRESFAPTRWLLTVTGAKASPAALAPAQVHFRRFALSGRALTPERGATPAGEFIFTVGPLAPRPGELLVTVSARRRDGKPFGHPTWLTVDADDPDRPDPMNDLEFYDMASVPAGTPEAKALRRSASARRFTEYAWFNLSQSLPRVRLRARLWTLNRETVLGDLLFRPVAETDLGTWDLTPLSHLRPQPVGQGRA